MTAERSYWPSPADFDAIVPRRRRRPATRFTPPAAGERKPLYLDGRNANLDVAVVGPALTVTCHGRRFQFPILRLSRVLVCGRVHWSSEAVALCLQHRIPIVFLDSGARPLGATLALRQRSAPLHESLTDFVESSNWRHSYENWLRAERLRVLLQWRRERTAAGSPLERREWIAKVRAHVYVPDPEHRSMQAAACYALALSIVMRAGARSQYRASDGSVLCLWADVGSLLDLRVELKLGSLARLEEGLGTLQVRGFQVDAPEHEAFVVGVLQRLHRRASECLEPWP